MDMHNIFDSSINIIYRLKFIMYVSCLLLLYATVAISAISTHLPGTTLVVTFIQVDNSMPISYYKWIFFSLFVLSLRANLGYYVTIIFIKTCKSQYCLLIRLPHLGEDGKYSLVAFGIRPLGSVSIFTSVSNY